MTALEFATLMVWVLLPPMIIGSVVLAFFAHRRPQFAMGRFIEAWILLIVLSVLLGLALVAWAPATIGRYIGIQDTPFTWAPFAFIAVTLALAPSLWWVIRGATRRSARCGK